MDEETRAELTRRLKGQLTCRVDEAARLMGVSRGAAFQAVKNGDWAACRVGHRILVHTGPLFRLAGADASEGQDES